MKAMQETTSEALPGCEKFEATLELLDGLLSGEGEKAARDHARACAVCGPLAAGWTSTSAAFVAAFEYAAERAKPDLADLATRVLDAVRPIPVAKPSTLAGRATALWRRLAAPVALVAAAAALFLVLRPAAGGGPNVPAAVPVASTGPNDLHMHSLAFGGADGMVFRTAQGGMTVIWVDEKPKA